jgi:hypothetical protein
MGNLALHLPCLFSERWSVRSLYVRAITARMVEPKILYRSFAVIAGPTWHFPATNTWQVQLTYYITSVF